MNVKFAFYHFVYLSVPKKTYAIYGVDCLGTLALLTIFAKALDFSHVLW